MYNLLEYNKNFSKTSVSLWNYYKDELTDETNYNNNPNKNVINSKSFNVPRRIRNAASRAINNPDYSANKEGTKEVKIAVKTFRQFLESIRHAID